MDQSSMNPRKNLAATVADNYPNNGGWGMHGSSSSVPAGNGVGLFGSRPPPPPPLYSTLPSFPVAPLSHQPPLLPLPFSKSATLPSPSKRVATTAIAASATDVRPRQHKQKPRPSAGSRKEIRSPGTARLEPKSVDKTQEEEGKDEDFLLGTSLYSISPPPSSLPIPRFSLTRPKGVSESTTAFCNVQAAGGGGGGGGVRGVDAGASDNLRRLLRL